MIADNNLGSDGTTGCDAYGGIVRTGDAIVEGGASDFHSPLADQWHQRDPLAHVTGLSLYEYVQPRR